MTPAKPATLVTPLRALIPLFVLPLFAVPGCRLGNKIDAQPIPVASSVDRTEGAIRDALRRNGWEVESSTPGLVVAHFVHEGLPVRVRITYDGEEAEILWVEGTESLGTDPEEIERSRKTIRRLLRGLAERVEYFVDSADLGAGATRP